MRQSPGLSPADDLVERLRRFYAADSDNWLDEDEAGPLMTEAADEIERLRAALKKPPAMTRAPLVRPPAGPGRGSGHPAATHPAAPLCDGTGRISGDSPNLASGGFPISAMHIRCAWDAWAANAWASASR